MILLVPTHPGCPGQNLESHKTVVCVCLCVSVYVSVVYDVVGVVSLLTQIYALKTMLLCVVGCILSYRRLQAPRRDESFVLGPRDQTVQCTIAFLLMPLVANAWVG